VCCKSQKLVVSVCKKCVLLNTVYVQYLQSDMVYNGNLNSSSKKYLCL
jgi:hypothetical protein